ncbi:transcriptional regulator [Nocardia sp. CS682]|uniref:transcriptional regulator n=1 Tax=Nocardia sp. CS682 TaxID=1047172 RepID=UPI001074C1B1|nr:transcriptional regulator [Nocardia sp. CS682]QBS44285.1 ArsR family transcriptional regulator [Nocardia sp. CS682]
MPELSELLASLPRLKLVAFLEGCGEAEFGVIARLCELNKSTMSKAMTVLEDAGYVSVRKGYAGRRPKTWLALTDSGRRAYREHLAALTALTQSAQQNFAQMQPTPDGT